MDSLSAANGARRRTSLTITQSVNAERSATFVAPRPLFDLITSALQASGHGPVIVAASRIGISRSPAARLCRIESGLPLGPVVTLELIGRLLFLGLAILRVNHQIRLRAVGRRRRWSIRIIGRVHDGVAAPVRLLGVVHIVGIVVGDAAEPHSRIIRGQYRYHEAGRRHYDRKSRPPRRVPNAAAEVVAAS